MTQEPTTFTMPQLDVVVEETATVEIDGQEYKIGRTKLKHLAGLAARLRSERLNAIMVLNGKIGGLIFANALGKCASVDPTEDDFWNYVNTERGSVYLLWRAMSEHQTLLTEEAVWELVEKEPTLITMLKTMSGLFSPNALDEAISGETTGPDPHPPMFGDQPQTGSENVPSSSIPGIGTFETSANSPGDSITDS